MILEINRPSTKYKILFSLISDHINLLPQKTFKYYVDIVNFANNRIFNPH